MSGNLRILEELKQINTSYGLDNRETDETIHALSEAKVSVPLIGKFSSGKSAVLNALLGKRLLKEDITPETAVPTELVFSPDSDSAHIFYNDGRSWDGSLRDYLSMNLDASEMRSVRLCLRNPALEQIPAVLLVDMPGFESGYEVHNRAIDNYLPNSLAYLAVFPADDLILRESMADILRELHLHNTPVAVVVTKYDKRNDEFEEALQALKEQLRPCLGTRDFPVLITSSYDRNAQELADYLLTLQNQSVELLERHFRRDVDRLLDVTETFLKTSLRNSALTESQLGEEEDRLRRQMDDLDASMEEERRRIEREVSGCAGQIRADVQRALEAEEERLVTMVLNKSSINGTVNSIVRRAVTEGIRRHFLPVVEQYLNRVSENFHRFSAGEIELSANVELEESSKEISSALVGAAAYLLIDLPIPILNLVLAGIAALVNSFLNERKREEAKAQIRTRLEGEVIPDILNQMEEALEREIARQMEQINAALNQRVQEQRAAVEKALADLKGRMNAEKAEKERAVGEMERDLQKLSALRGTGA